MLVGNFFFAVVVFILYMLFTVYLVKLAGKYKDKKQ